MTDERIQLVERFLHHRRVPLDAESFEFVYCIQVWHDRSPAMNYLSSVTWTEHEFRIPPEFKSIYFRTLGHSEGHAANTLEGRSPLPY